MKRITKTCLYLALATMTQPLCGEVVLEDAFGYPDGDLIGAAGSTWSAHSGGGNGPVQVQSGTLELRNNQSEDISALLNHAPYATDGPTAALYAGFTVRVLELPSSSGSYFAHFRNAGGSFRGRVWISRVDAGDGSFRLSIGNSTGASGTSGPWPQDLALDTDYLVVIRFELATGLATLWVDPVTETDPGVIASDAVGLIPVSNFSFRQSSGIGVLRVDDLKVADSFAEVAGPAMRLAIEREGSNIKVSWPVSVEGALLQSSPDLAVPDWSEVADAPVVEGERQVVRFAPGAAARFFRLMQP